MPDCHVTDRPLAAAYAIEEVAKVIGRYLQTNGIPRQRLFDEPSLARLEGAQCPADEDPAAILPFEAHAVLFAAAMQLHTVGIRVSDLKGRVDVVAVR